ncbi:hypothetical protein B0H13DRAFT_2331813 [Mycena leptocephala]|nr:hypothetical protein B0H13DRAFT_2331813 [Mycena leptocephala]
MHVHTSLSGPVAGRTFEVDNPAPRAVSKAWFDVVCPRRECRYINTRNVKPAVNQVLGIEVLNHWQMLLHDVPQRCIEIVPASRKETFDLVLWGGPRVVMLRDSFSQSPISRLSAALPSSLPPSTCMLGLHLRRGDYEGCLQTLSPTSCPL